MLWENAHLAVITVGCLPKTSHYLMVWSSGFVKKQGSL